MLAVLLESVLFCFTLLCHNGTVLLAIAGLLNDQAVVLSRTAVGRHKGEEGAVVMGRSA